MSCPLISVVVPVYNNDKYTGLCIESIINQTYANLDIIIVDDGSSDQSPAICDLYASKDNRIRVIHKSNGGLVSARKVGVESAFGEYVGYVDGDDWIGEEYFELVAQEIISENPDVIISGWTRVFFNQEVKRNNNYLSGRYSGKALDKLKSEMISKGKFFTHGISTYVWNKVFRKDILIDSQMNVDDRLMLGEDACVSYAAILASQSVSIIENYEYHYRQHEDSILKKKVDYVAEIERLKVLYHNLIECITSDLISRQHIIDYVLACCIIRMGGLLPNKQTFIFGNEFPNKRIVIYSAGTFGQAFVSKIIEKQICDLVAWIDDDFKEYRRSCLNVDPVEYICNIKYDYLIVATVDGELAEEITIRLTKLGVDRSKIITIDLPMECRSSLLNKYLEL